MPAWFLRFAAALAVEIPRVAATNSSCKQHAAPARHEPIRGKFTPMTLTAETLRELHRILRQITDLRGRLERGPRQIKAAKANLQALEQAEADAKETLTRAKVAADQKQLQLKERENRIGDLKAKLNLANSNKEYQAIKEQIAADEQANSVLSDEILDALEKIDELQANLEEAKAGVGKQKDELAKVQTRVSEQQAQLESELGRVTAELETVQKRIPADLRAEYDRLVKGRGEEALAQVEGEYCGGCNFKLTAQMMNELLIGKPVFCKNCGSLLYMPENRSV
jgi:predicted  nucleic acid-binding Zn-ribbon protein